MRYVIEPVATLGVMQRERAFAIVGSMVTTTGTSQKTWAFNAAVRLPMAATP
jgi:hypothetical protein